MLKRILSLCFVISLFSTPSHAQTDSLPPFEAPELEAYFSHSSFLVPNQGPYVEFYLSLYSPTLYYKLNENQMYQAAVEVTYIISKGEEVEKFKKFVVLSPEVLDPEYVNANFIDLQRFSLENGKYDLEIIVTDTNSSALPFKATQEIIVEYPEKTFVISDIELIDTYRKSNTQGIYFKNGYDIIPRISNFFPEGTDKLKFYAEMYHSNELDDSSGYVIKYYVRSFESKAVVNSLIGYVKKTNQVFDAIYKELDLSKLPTGNFELVIEAIDREAQLLDQVKLFFQRSNPTLQISEEDLLRVEIATSFVDKYNNKDSLRFFTESLSPIASEAERSFIKHQLPTTELDILKRFFYNFWAIRQPLNPEAEWLKYKELIDFVEKEYATKVKRGYQTDRGRIYLQHGKPNTVSKQYNEPMAYPYEVWHYYTIDVRSDARFLFYNPDLISNDFELLHSNVFNEIRDYRWKFRLMRRGQHVGDIDNPGVIDERWSNRAEEIFNAPR